MFASVKKSAYVSVICPRLFIGVHYGSASTAAIPLEGASRLSRRPTPSRPYSLFALFSRRGLFSKVHHLAYTSCCSGGRVCRLRTLREHRVFCCPIAQMRF